MNFFSWTFRPGSAIPPPDRQKPGRKMSRNPFRRHLSMPGMLQAVRACLHRIPDPISTRGIGLSDCLMSGPAVFSFRMPSLPQSGRQVRGGGDPVMARNLRPLSGVGRAPSDAWMRQRLDGAGPRDLRRRLTGIHAALRRGKAPGDGRCPAAIRSSPSTAPGTIPPTVSAAATAASGSTATGRGHTITRLSGPRSSIPTSGRCRRWRRSRSAGRTARGGTTAGGTRRDGPSGTRPGRTRT